MYTSLRSGFWGLACLLAAVLFPVGAYATPIFSTLYPTVECPPDLATYNTEFPSPLPSPLTTEQQDFTTAEQNDSAFQTACNDYLHG